MKSNMIELIKNSASNNNFYDLENIFTLYEQLQFSKNLKQMASDTYNWLNKTFKINNVNFYMFDIEKDKKETIFTKGEEFFLDDNLSFFFIINTDTKSNAIISFCATSQEHYNLIEKKYSVIESSFFQISPMIQNGILKKNYIESLSIDSVTNVYNRKYFIENLNKQLKLKGNNENQISFFMVGVDHFKAVIDEFDYNISDNVLVELAKVLHSNIKEHDMVARLTDNEFIVSIVDSHEYKEIIEIANNMISDFSKIEIKVNDKGQVLKKTICIGIDTFYTNKNQTIDEVIKNADIALYEAKNKGRSQVVYFEEAQTTTIDLF